MVVLKDKFIRVNGSEVRRAFKYLIKFTCKFVDNYSAICENRWNIDAMVATVIK